MFQGSKSSDPISPCHYYHFPSPFLAIDGAIGYNEAIPLFCTRLFVSYVTPFPSPEKIKIFPLDYAYVPHPTFLWYVYFSTTLYRVCASYDDIMMSVQLPLICAHVRLYILLIH